METAAEASPEAAAILADAGWAPHPEWRLYTRDTRVAGITPDGTSLNVKNWAMITPDDPRYGPDTPDTAEEAAGWLVAWHNARAVVMTTDATLDPISLSGMSEAELAPPPEPEHDSAHEGDGETGEEAEAGPRDGQFGGDGELLGAETALVAGEASPGSEDAVWTEHSAADLGSDESSDLPELGQEIAEEHPEEIGPIAYGASTVDALVREKMGRLSQLARQYKAELQVGWTLDEFRSLQGLMVRMERGEAQNDAASRERYFWISARSRAMSSVDEHRDKREAILEEIGARRDFNAAVEFDPEANWP